jgi:endonuclease/exonuclease/phosphatase family metal-dependent hydrolase
MKLAAFNLENLFDRAVALNQPTWAEGKPALEEVVRLNKLFAKTQYSSADKTQIRAGLGKLNLLKKDDGGKFALLRQNRGKLLKRPKSGPVEVVANGRADWIGWVELKTGPVDEIATRNTAQVIRDVGADIFGVIEVDNRTALRRFNDELLKTVGAAAYRHVMVIDGNDDRGIDVGLLTRFPIMNMRSHVDDLVDGGRVFSRDCPEYEIQLPSGTTLLLLINHMKSKGFGSQNDSNKRRRNQAQRVRDIYDARRQAGAEFVAVIGDFNDTPDSDPLLPLLQDGSDLRDVSQSSAYLDDGRPGTFGNGTKSQKIDYILLSPELFVRVDKAAVFRKGAWGGKDGDLWEHYDNMTSDVHAASDHAAIWVELNV